jgi:thioredoxin reductase
MEQYEFVVVGGGPSGMSGAIEAARAGLKRVAIIDETPTLGGQLVKQTHKFFGGKAHRAGERGIEIGVDMERMCGELGIEILRDTVVWGIFNHDTLALYHHHKSRRIGAKAILLATGASENNLACPGWTLPGVMGAGAIQTMMNVHRVLPGKKILMVGSGNVGLIVSYQLLQAGAEVSAVIDILPKIGGYGVHASKITRLSIPILVSHTLKEIRGKDRVEEAVTIEVDANFRPIPGTEKTYPVDTVCMAVGLSPLSELAWMCGCEFRYIPELGGWVPCRRETMETTVPGIYIAGDVSGIEEASTAIMTGAIAGLSVAEKLGYLDPAKSKALRQEKTEGLVPFRCKYFEFRHTANLRLMEMGGVMQ